MIKLHRKVYCIAVLINKTLYKRLPFIGKKTGSFMALNTGAQKSLFDLSDIMSILEDDSKDKVLKVVDAVAQTAVSEPVEAPRPEPKPEPAVQQDNALISKLLSDIDIKNAELLKLNADIMNLKLEIKDKDVRIKELVQKVDELNRLLEESKTAIKTPELAKPLAKVSEPVYNIKEKEEATDEEDVATIFKRLTRPASAPEPENEDAGEKDPLKKPQQPRKPKTAKLYDL